MAGAEDFLGTSYYNSNPMAAFYKRFGLGQNTAFNRYANSRYGDIYNKYQGQLPDNPNQGFYEFLGGMDLGSEFGNLAPQLRGDQSFRSPNVMMRRRRF